MTPAAPHHLLAQRVRWERMHVAIRCGLHPTQPALIRVYLGVGRWLVRQGQLDERVAHQRMLGLLLDTARDDALPWFWRSLCLEHTSAPLARLTTLLKQREPSLLGTVQDSLASARMALTATPAGPALRPAETKEPWHGP